MKTAASTNQRKKINFMINVNVVTDLQKWIPAGQRSDFVNNALEAALKRQVREKASKEMDRIRETYNWKMSNEEIKKAVNYGRK